MIFLYLALIIVAIFMLKVLYGQSHELRGKMWGFAVFLNWAGLLINILNVMIHLVRIIQ